MHVRPCTHVGASCEGHLAPDSPPGPPGQNELKQDADGRVELPRGGGGGVRALPHGVHGGVLHEGGGGDAADEEEDVQAEAGVQDGDGGGGGGGVEASVQREGHG